MAQSILKYAMAALVAVSGMSALAPAANAGGPDVQFGVYVRDGYGYGRDRDYREYRPGPPRHHMRDRCSLRQAENKAERMGIRRARVIDAGPRRVVVGGFSRYGRDRVVFANVRGCPVIRR